MTTFATIKDAPFTTWLVAQNLLPGVFDLVDVGVLGGVNERWSVLGEKLAGVGFDLDAEAIRTLSLENVNPQFHYHHIALGDVNEQRRFEVREHNFNNSLLPEPGNCKIVGQEEVRVSRLDSLVAEGIAPVPNFLKLDTEGYEIAILHGCGRLLEEPSFIGGEFETGFYPVDGIPHIFALHQILSRHGFVVFDWGYGRLPRSTLPYGRLTLDANQQVTSDQIGQIAHIDLLFMRDFATTDPRREVGTDTALKAAIIFELYGLNDCAIEVVNHYEAQLGSGFDIAKARNLLTPTLSENAITYELYQQIGQLVAAGNSVTAIPAPRIP